MTRALALLALVVPALAAAGVRPAWGGTIRVGVPSAPRASDDAADPADLLLMSASSAALLELDPRGRLVPGALAEVPVPEDGGRVFRLRLRPGIVDAAGRPVSAGDVALRLTALLQRSSPSPNAFVALPIAGSEAVLEGRSLTLAGLTIVSRTELLVTLSAPLPQFPLLLAAAPAGIPGAGPFAMTGAGEPGTALRLVSNDRHHRGRPFADTLQILPGEPRNAARLLERGDLDLLLRPEAVGDRSHLLPLRTATVAAVNAERLGPDAEPLRGALAALDRAELARRFVRGAAEPLETLVPGALLAGAPANAAAPRRAAPGRLPKTISIVADAFAADQRAVAERIQVQLFDRGVRASLELVEGAARLRARLTSRDWDVALVSVTLLAADPALAAGQIAWAARGAAAARRVLSELANPVSPEDTRAAAARLAGELDLVPLVATEWRVSLSPTLAGLTPGAGGVDLGGLWLPGGRGETRPDLRP